MKIKKLLSMLICDLFHEGGIVKHDKNDRVNWQCKTCGRWAHDT